MSAAVSQYSSWDSSAMCTIAVVPQPICVRMMQPQMGDEAWEVEWGLLQQQWGLWGTGMRRTAGQKASGSHKPEQPVVVDPTELPSIGSEGHATGECKRCAFFPKGRCKNGKDCTHCHFPHDERRTRRRRGTRNAARSEGQENEDVGLEETLVDEEPNADSSDEACELITLPPKAEIDEGIVFGDITPCDLPKAPESVPAKCQADSAAALQKDGAAFASIFGGRNPIVRDEQAERHEQTSAAVVVAVEDSPMISLLEAEEAVRLAEEEAQRLEAEAEKAHQIAVQRVREAKAVCVGPSLLRASFDEYYRQHISPSCTTQYWAALQKCFQVPSKEHKAILKEGKTASLVSEDPQPVSTVSEDETTVGSASGDVASPSSEGEASSESEAATAAVPKVPKESSSQRPKEAAAAAQRPKVRKGDAPDSCRKPPGATAASKKPSGDAAESGSKRSAKLAELRKWAGASSVSR